MRKTSVKLAVIAAAAVLAAMVAAAIVFNLFIGWKIESDAIGDIEYALDMGDVPGAGRQPNYLLVDSSYNISATERRWSTNEEAKLAAWFSEHPDEGRINRIDLGDWTCYAAIMPLEDAYAGYGGYYGGAYDGYYDGYYGGAYDGYDNGAYDGYDSAPGGYYDGDYAGRNDAYAGRNDAYDGAAYARRFDPYGPLAESSRGRAYGYYIAYIDISAEQSLVFSVNAAFAIIAVIGALIAAAAGHMAGRRIDEAQDAQKRFYENMSHELKTPLAAIGGFAEGAAQGVVDINEATRAIGRETNRMAKMIDEILGLSRLEAGAVTLKKEAVEVDDFVQDCLMPFEGAVRSRGLAVTLDLADGTIQADPDLFDHALSNVLTNAVRHAATTICVSYAAGRLAVWNDGRLPTEEQLAHLFDRFYTGEGGSTGIGLAIAKEIAVLHGWTINAAPRDDGLEISFSF